MDQRILFGDSDLTDLIVEEINGDMSEKIQQGRLNQLDLAKLNRDNPFNMIDGLGETKLSVDEDIYHAYRIQMKDEMKDPEYECWHDPDFINYIYKECPELRAKNSGRIVKSEGLVA
jgi:hypothetical protein